MQRDDGREPRPEDAGAAHASPHHGLDRPLAQAFGIGALAGMVLLGVIWVTVSAVTHDPASAGRGERTGIDRPVPHDDGAASRPDAGAAVRAGWRGRSSSRCTRPDRRWTSGRCTWGR